MSVERPTNNDDLVARALRRETVSFSPEDKGPDEGSQLDDKKP